jgi:hypothetical protein
LPALATPQAMMQERARTVEYPKLGTNFCGANIRIGTGGR